MLTKNDRVELEITGMTSEGCGVGRHDGLAVFVPNTVQGETVLAHIIKAKKNYAVGKCIEIIKHSDKRIESDCTVSERCGGCVFRHISYEEECKIKFERVRDAVRKIGGIDTEISPILPSAEVDYYRNKAQYPVRMENGEVKIGFFAQRTHRIVSSDGCKLQRREFDDVLHCFEKWIKENGISVYDEVTNRGELRHVYIRRAHKTGQIMVCAVINAPELTKKDALIALLTQNVQGLTSVVVNVNRKQTNVILGSEFKTIWGEDKIEDELCGVRLKISPHSFYQVNSPQAERLYNLASEYADLKGGERVLDIYCGIGSVGLCAAKNAGELIGFEIVDRAVQNARENALLNGFKNTEFFCADAATAFEYLENRGRFDVVFLDPPRKGCDERLIDDIAKSNPEKIVYISCDPATLARDLKRFSEKGYKTEKITPVDMFPRTHHVESVVCLSREKADDCEEETKMISDERSKYKSWSNLKKQMNDLLCDSLKDKISYFYTSYHEVHNAYGRATINYCKKEIAAFSWIEQYAQQRDIIEQYKKMDNVPSALVDFEGSMQAYRVANATVTKEKWMPNCTLCEADFINSLTIYLKTDIATALHSENYLLRVFAYMDRRVGKRTLVKIKDEVEKLPDWVKQFYRIRCEADGIVFPPKRITDETVVLLTRG